MCFQVLVTCIEDLVAQLFQRDPGISIALWVPNRSKHAAKCCEALILPVCSVQYHGLLKCCRQGLGSRRMEQAGPLELVRRSLEIALFHQTDPDEIHCLAARDTVRGLIVLGSAE